MPTLIQASPSQVLGAQVNSTSVPCRKVRQVWTCLSKGPLRQLPEEGTKDLLPKSHDLGAEPGEVGAHQTKEQTT